MQSSYTLKLQQTHQFKITLAAGDFLMTGTYSTRFPKHGKKFTSEIFWAKPVRKHILAYSWFFFLMAFSISLVGIAFFIIHSLLQILKNTLDLQGIDQEVLRQQDPAFHSDVQMLFM